MCILFLISCFNSPTSFALINDEDEVIFGAFILDATKEFGDSLDTETG